MKPLLCATLSFLVSLASVPAFADSSVLQQTVKYTDKPEIIPPYSMQQYDAKINQLYKHSPVTQDIDARVIYFSAAFLGKPYLLGALGEGPKADIDQSPLYRTDAFDCTTYVATVLALAESNNLDEFKKNIIKINYAENTVSYATRNHFMETDWNSKNQTNGFLQDITSFFTDEEGKSVAKIARTTIEKNNWFLKKTPTTLKTLTPLSAEEITSRMGKLHAAAKLFQPEAVSMPYIPLTALFNKKGVANKKLFAQFPAVAVVEIVRPDWAIKDAIGTSMNVTHMGFSIRQGNSLIFREASLRTKTVRDIALEDYLRSLLDTPSIQGVHVQKVLHPNNQKNS